MWEVGASSARDKAMNKRYPAWGINLCVSPVSADSAPGRSICGSLRSGERLRKLSLSGLSRRTQRIDPSTYKYRRGRFQRRLVACFKNTKGWKWVPETFRLEMGFGFLTRRVINLCSSLPGTRVDSAWGPSRGCQVPTGYLV